MNALTRFDSIDQWLPQVLRRFADPMHFPEGAAREIRLDVTENEKDYQVRAEIPGASKDDIRVTVHDNQVSISAEVKKEREEKSGGRVLLKETVVGSVSRSFSLPHEIDAKAVAAKLEDGILKLTLPKREGAGSRLIPIQ